MASKFRPGATAYAPNGRAYVVDDVADGIVYCSLPSGAESEFPEAALLTEAERQLRSDKRRGRVPDRPHQTPPQTQKRPKPHPPARAQRRAEGHPPAPA